VWGLGELLVKGRAVPDEIELSLKGVDPEILGRTRGARDVKAVLTAEGGVEVVPVDSLEKDSPPVHDNEAALLAAWARLLEGRFGSPQDMEWCRDRAGRLVILQSRPLGVEKPAKYVCDVELSGVSNPVLLSGGERAVSGIGKGRVFVASASLDLEDIPKGSVLVAASTPPRYAMVMDRLTAVVTDLGAVAGHFASVAREWGVPTLVNTGEATRVLEHGEMVTVDADSARVFAGEVEAVSEPACQRDGVPPESPFMKRLGLVLEHCAPLNLLDPRAASFMPRECRTLHDIVRFVHEKSVQEMFSLGSEKMRRARGTRRLVSDIPVTLYVLDLEEERPGALHRRGDLPLHEVENMGLRALWRGLGDPDIAWSPDVRHFDWEEFDRLSAGIISVDSRMFASFAVLSGNYLNIHIRFGYHFTTIDSLFGPVNDQNYVSFRFRGGGAVPERKALRVHFLYRVLKAHGFEVDPEGDGIDVKRHGISTPDIEKSLEMLGFLLGFTRLLDHRLENMSLVEAHVERFLEKFPPREGVEGPDGS
jgi:pyruvate, water dikinase